jgi:hypothetical protein
MLKQKQVGEVGRRVLCPLLGLALGAQSPPLRAQAPADPDVARGIQQIQAGDLDAGIFTLDAVVQRLAREPARSREASLAYLYLGVAYLGKSLESAAKAKFREAVLRDKDLTVSPDQFPPKVIDLFEAAKREATEKKGSKTGLILLGIGAAAAGGAALALGGSAGPSAAPSPRPTPTPPPATASLERTFAVGETGQLSENSGEFFVGPPGEVTATARWSNSCVITFWLDLHPVLGASPIAPANQNNQVTTFTAERKWPGLTPGNYFVRFFYQCSIRQPDTIVLRIEYTTG